MNTRWLIGISKDKQEDTKKAIKDSTIVLRQLKAILLEEIAALDRIPVEDYETPSWAYKEADRHGQLRAFRKLLTLVN